MTPAPSDDRPVVTRFAPSPSGYLHLGHAYSALLNAEHARAAGGRFLLRIEDIDRTRCRPDFEAAILEDLAWLGLAWDEPPLRQSDRLPIYERYLADLEARGLVYRCFKTRRDIADAMAAPHGAPAGAFRGAPLDPEAEQAALAAGRPFAWRLSLATARAALGPVFDRLSFVETTATGRIARPADPARFGDVVLGRKEIGTSYHLAAVVDDALQGVTHVTRGEDLREAAGLHVLLGALFGFAPPVYRHHTLIRGPDGRRLAKRDRAETLRTLRAAGVTPAEVRARLAAV
ncbi:MAG: tRNA glutamyl-Q(34) synthetase GluQRS [Alphaproteobacteria bacterium]|nr:tRNA glutamyl-Q(34) synthetase GluQRS [Alphaproteobacteria bacterium]